jgi:hypothetical protein
LRIGGGGGVEVARLFHELIRPRGEGTPIFFKKTHWGCLGGLIGSNVFLLQKFHPMATVRLTLVIIFIGDGITKSKGQNFITW